MKSDYDGKPWLDAYPEWLPKSLQVPNQSVLDRFENAFRKYPDDPCIFYFDTILRFNEIHAMADSLATAFKEMGVQKNDRIVLWMQNIPQVAVATIAAWIRGAIVVPANPMYTIHEIQYLLDDCGAKVMICQDDLYKPEIKGLSHVVTTSPLDFLNQKDEPPHQLKETWKAKPPDTSDFMHLAGDRHNAQTDHLKPGPWDLAYLVYTSGTTGPPKGAMISHSNIAYNCRVYEESCRLDRNDRILGVAPLFHITGIVAHLALAFHLGIPMLLFNRFDVPEALRLIERWKLTFTVASITVYIALLNHPESKNYDLSSLVKAYSGGSPISPGIAEKLKAVLGITLYNVYGLTESASPATITPIGLSGPIDPESGALSVGLVAPGLEAWVMDVDDPEKILPIGHSGELVLRGPCIAAGYWNKPEESAHAIRNGRFYTGDIAKIDEKGWCYIVDRKKDLINVSGFKVWPRDVEDVLYQHPGVKEAAVVGVPDAYRGETVKAFVSLTDAYQGKVSPEEIIAFCKSRMAAFKYPRMVKIIDDVPKSSTGKFLRRMLKTPD